MQLSVSRVNVLSLLYEVSNDDYANVKNHNPFIRTRLDKSWLTLTSSFTQIYPTVLVKKIPHSYYCGSLYSESSLQVIETSCCPPRPFRRMRHTRTYCLFDSACYEANVSHGPVSCIACPPCPLLPLLLLFLFLFLLLRLLPFLLLLLLLLLPLLLPLLHLQTRQRNLSLFGSWDDGWSNFSWAEKNCPLTMRNCINLCLSGNNEQQILDIGFFLCSCRLPTNGKFNIKSFYHFWLIRP